MKLKLVLVSETGRVTVERDFPGFASVSDAAQRIPKMPVIWHYNVYLYTYFQPSDTPTFYFRQAKGIFSLDGTVPHLEDLQ
jgi:hypothetical protein